MNWSTQGKQLDPTRIYTDNTGFGQLPAPSRQVDYYIQSCNWHPPKKIYDAASNDTTQDFSAITDLVRRAGDRARARTVHHVCPSAGSRQVSRRDLPAWLDYVTETLEAKGMSGRLDGYIQASGTHIVRTYKENIERARRTRGLSGFQLLDIRDFPGQGHATTGILDMFWDSKGLIEPETFAEFNGAVTLLMRAPSPTFWNGGVLAVEIDASNFGYTDIPAGALTWQLRSAETMLSGQIDVPEAPAGKLTAFGRLEIQLPADRAARAWELSVELGSTRNRWHVWSYPQPQLIDDAARISTRLRDLRPALSGADFSDDFFTLGMFGDSRLPPSDLAISDRLTGGCCNICTTVARSG